MSSLSLRGRLWAVVACAALGAAACTGEPAASPSAAPTTDGVVVATPPPLPVDEQVLAAHRAFVEALPTALNGHTEALGAVASGDAVDTVAARAATRAEEEQQVSGRLVSSADVERVDVSGDGATVTDCVRNDLQLIDADGTTVEEATGHRRPLTTELQETSDGWVVTEVTDSGLDGPRPDLEILGDELPDPDIVCVPDSVDAAAVEDAYQHHWDVVYSAGAPEDGGPADPDDPRLPEVAAGARLDNLRQFLGQRKNEGLRVTARSSHDPTVLALADDDSKLLIRDCWTALEGGVERADSGETVSTTPAGHQVLAVLTMNAAPPYRLEASTILDEGPEACGARQS